MLAARLAARLRAISGAEEDWIAGLADPGAPAAAHELLARCLGSPGGDAAAGLDEVRTLTLAERDWLLLQLHQRSFGRDIVGDVCCPACGSLSEIRFAARDVFAAPGDDNPFDAFPLPGGATALLRKATAADHEHFWANAARDAHAQEAAAIARLVVFTQVPPGMDPVELTADDRRALARALDASIPEPVRLDLTCQQCNGRFDAPFEPAAFVVGELIAHSRTLLNDVHTLASAYHWSETDILRLPLARRLAYLDRIDADRTGTLVQEARSR